MVESKHTCTELREALTQLRHTFDNLLTKHENDGHQIDNDDDFKSEEI